MQKKRVLVGIPIILAILIIFLIILHPLKNNYFLILSGIILVFLLGLLIIIISNNKKVEKMQGELNEIQVISDHLYNALIGIRNSIMIMSNSSTKISGLATTNEQSISQSNEVMNNLTNSIKENFDVVGETADKVTAARQEAEKGEENAENARIMINQINTDVDNSRRLAESLTEKSKIIEGIVNLITDVSEQTKLLALNAAIEASRAGDAGKGFEVVADEIRKLSEETGVSVKKISKLLDEVTTSTNDVVSSMVKTSHEVGLGTNVINGALESLKRISRSTSESTKFVDDVYSMFEQQIAGTKTVEHSLTEIHKISKDNQFSIDEVSQGLNKISDLILQLEENSKKLADVARELNERR